MLSVAWAFAAQAAQVPQPHSPWSPSLAALR